MTTTTFERVSRDPAFQELFNTGHRRRLAKGKVILSEGEAPKSLYFIMAGSVAVQLSDWNGREVLLAYMHAGDFFGEMGLLSGATARSATVVTRSECLLLEISYPQFLQLTSRHNSLWMELASQLAARLRATNRRLAELPTLPAADRVWSVIAELAEHVDEADWVEGQIPLRITRQDLGKLAGCSREAAGDALQQFAADGRLSLQGHQILVPPRVRSAL